MFFETAIKFLWMEVDLLRNLLKISSKTLELRVCYFAVTNPHQCIPLQNITVWNNTLQEFIVWKRHTSSLFYNQNIKPKNLYTTIQILLSDKLVLSMFII